MFCGDWIGKAVRVSQAVLPVKVRGAVQLFGVTDSVNFWRLICLLVCIVILNACFHDVNYPPTANAGADVVASVSDTVSLDGSQSSDVNGDSLTYLWEIIDRPESSLAVLSSTGTAKPQLTLDVDGQYVVQLIVSDGKKKSKADFVTISTFNEKPVAVISELSAPNGQQYIAGESISVSAIDSYDAEGQNLFYTWEITVKPDASKTTLSNRLALNPTFLVDVAGHYIVHLIVSDGKNLSEPQMMIFEVAEPARKHNSIPFAEAGTDQVLYEANTLVQLDGSESYDNERDVLTFKWEMVYKPESSNAILSSVNSALPQFTADILGSYVIKLVVSDGDGESHLDTVIVTPHENTAMPCGDCHEKPQVHQLAYDDCGACHTLTAWKPVDNSFHAHGHVARPDVCEVCHNGVKAKGKDAQHHIVTDKDCNYCHFDLNLSWLPGLKTPVTPTFDHVGIKSACIACHNNEKQQGKPQGHMAVSNRCFACHTTQSWSSGLHLEHTEIFASCVDCHDGVKAVGKKVGRIATQQSFEKLVILRCLLCL